MSYTGEYLIAVGYFDGKGFVDPPARLLPATEIRAFLAGLPQVAQEGDELHLLSGEIRREILVTPKFVVLPRLTVTRKSDKPIEYPESRVVADALCREFGVESADL